MYGYLWLWSTYSISRMAKDQREEVTFFQSMLLRRVQRNRGFLGNQWHSTVCYYLSHHRWKSQRGKPYSFYPQGSRNRGLLVIRTLDMELKDICINRRAYHLNVSLRSSWRHMGSSNLSIKNCLCTRPTFSWKWQVNFWVNRKIRRYEGLSNLSLCPIVPSFKDHDHCQGV